MHPATQAAKKKRETLFVMVLPEVRPAFDFYGPS